uniref:Uncharacterized protein n=1 Tax=Arundo donax TaxID=35708 RepID=A0A0A9FIM3_ARUDO
MATSASFLTPSTYHSYNLGMGGPLSTFSFGSVLVLVKASILACGMDLVHFSCV